MAQARCELCYIEPALWLSCFRTRTEPPISDWKLTGICDDSADYDIALERVGTDEQVHEWFEHLGGKRWFTAHSALSFMDAVRRMRGENVPVGVSR